MNLYSISRSRPWLSCRLYSTGIPYTKLRPYQKDCITTSLSKLKEGCQKQVVSLPVGSGKTVIMSNLIPLIPNPTPKATKVLLLAHRTELLDQAHNQIKKYNPDLVVHVEQGKRKVDIDSADVIVASVPRLGRENSVSIDKYDPSLFKAILIDEAHHAVASTYVNILKHFGAYDTESNILVWGCSATVRRHDGLSLYDVFNDITYHVDFLKMIEDGYLSQMRVTTINTKVDLDNVGTGKYDFKQEELSHAVNTTTRNEVILSSWKKYAHEKDRKSTLVFAVDIPHTVELCNTFRDAGIEASFITSKTPALTRYQILQDFKDGKIPVLVNCAILTEGTDIPRVDCILLAKPTKSSVLFQQMFGRGLRLYPGKEDCLVIDFVDNFKSSGSAGLVTIPTLLGLSAKEMVEDQDILSLEKRARIEQEIQEKVEQEQEKQMAEDPSLVKVQITEYDSLKELLIDLSGTSELRNASPQGWVDVGTNKCVLHILTKGYVVLSKLNGTWKGSFLVQNSAFRSKLNIPLEADNLTCAIRAADTWIQKKFGNILGVLMTKMSRNAAFRRDCATEAQKKALGHYNIKTPDHMTKGQAMDLLTKLKFGQLKIWKSQQTVMKIEKAEQEKKMKAAVLTRNRVI